MLELDGWDKKENFGEDSLALTLEFDPVPVRGWAGGKALLHAMFARSLMESVESLAVIGALLPFAPPLPFPALPLPKLNGPDSDDVADVGESFVSRSRRKLRLGLTHGE